MLIYGEYNFLKTFLEYMISNGDSFPFNASNFIARSKMKAKLDCLIRI